VTSLELLADLNRRGVRLTIAGTRLRVDAPADVLTPADWQAIADAKSALIDILAIENLCDPATMHILAQSPDLAAQAAALLKHADACVEVDDEVGLHTVRVALIEVRSEAYRRLVATSANDLTQVNG